MRAIRTLTVTLALVAVASVAWVAVQSNHGRTVSGFGEAIAAPLSPPSPSVAPNPGRSSTESTASWTLISYPDGHLRVRMPSAVDEQVQSGGNSGVSFTVHVAVAVDSVGGRSPVEAACEDITQAVSGSADQVTTMRASVVGFGIAARVSLVSQSAATFRGHTARVAEFTHDGQASTLLVFFDTDQRLYILYAPKGTPYDTLSSSFTTLP